MGTDLNNGWCMLFHEIAGRACSRDVALLQSILTNVLYLPVIEWKCELSGTLVPGRIRMPSALEYANLTRILPTTSHDPGHWISRARRCLGRTLYANQNNNSWIEKDFGVNSVVGVRHLLVVEAKARSVAWGYPMLHVVTCLQTSALPDFSAYVTGTGVSCHVA